MAIKRACATRVKGPRKQQNARTKNPAGQSLRGKVVFLGRMKKKAARLRVGCIRAAALSPKGLAQEVQNTLLALVRLSEHGRRCLSKDLSRRKFRRFNREIRVFNA